jgi:lysine 2,3-aminomutase
MQIIKNITSKGVILMGSRIQDAGRGVQTRTMPETADVSVSNEEPDPFPSSSQSIISETADSRQKPRRQIKDSVPANVSIAELFRRRIFPSVSPAEWNDWRWQLRNRISSTEEIGRIIDLSPQEKEALSGKSGKLPVAVTPYYMSLVNPTDPSDPVRRSMIPVDAEFLRSPGEAEDPLGEDHQSPVHGLVHRYPDRVLFLATNQCAAYCRYCTRSRMVGHREPCSQSHPSNWEKIFRYIRQHTEVRDVLISGGDPLTMPDEVLEYLLINLRAIKHVEVIRIGTKAPVVMPQRITSQLVKLLKQFHPLWINIHFTHPTEITPETARACNRLADAGIPLGSQTVLLNGINDDVNTLKTLFHKLLTLRVRPYYLYQCDPILGSAHFRTPVSSGISILRQLQGFTTGFAVPRFVIDAPGGGGKIPVNPEYLEGNSGSGDVKLKNYEGKVFTYPGVT